MERLVYNEFTDLMPDPFIKKKKKMIKEEILLTRREGYYKGYGGQEILNTYDRNKQKIHQKSKAFQSLWIYERETPLKRSCALHQAEVHLILPHKTCLSKCLPLEMQEVCSNQIHQTMA